MPVWQRAVTSSSHREAAPSAAEFFSLVYVLIYFLPWPSNPPTPLDLTAGVIGFAAFLAIYLRSLYAGSRAAVFYAIVVEALGLALAPFHGVWTIFNVYACAVAARAPTRQTVIVAIVGLQIVFTIFGLILRHDWYIWLPSIIIGPFAALGIRLRAELQYDNSFLRDSQEQVRQIAEKGERERIARDLHDLLGQTLTLVAVKAELAARLSEADPRAAKKEMDDVARVSREALSEVREALRGMSNASLRVELQRARMALSAANIRAEIKTDRSVNISQADAVLAMALREAITNVIRHAGATRCRIHVGHDDRRALRLSVVDDGRGGPIMEGSGLTGMRTRLSAAGGSLQIRADKEGTELLALMPEGSPS